MAKKLLSLLPLSTLKYLWSTFGNFKKSAIVLLVLMVFSASAEGIGLATFMPLIEIITEGQPNSAFGRLIQPVLELFPRRYGLVVGASISLSLIILKDLLMLTTQAYGSRFTWRMRQRWRTDIFRNYLFSPYSYFLKHKQGELLNNLLLEPNRAADMLQSLVAMMSDLILASTLYIVLLISSWQATLIATLIFFVLYIVARNTSQRYAQSVGEKRVSYAQNLSAIANETIAGIRQVKTFGSEKHVKAGFDDLVDREALVSIKFYIARYLPVPVSEIVVILVIAAGISYVSLFSEVDLKSLVPLLGLFTVVSKRLLGSFSSIISQGMVVLAGIPSLKIAHELSRADMPQEDLQRGIPFQSLVSDIRFDNVSFAHPSREHVFANLNLVIPRGKITALVGPSGSGKSTITDLLIGLSWPQEGGILVNGRNLREYNLESWRRKVGFVSQDTFVFNASIRGNILVGRPEATEEEIQAAARKAYAHDFIVELPDGYDTIVGDRGLKLSGGERQRIAIARAIIRDPDFYIFDEATSSLDQVSERAIQESIDALGDSKTVLVIAHRLSTIENADVIYDLGELLNLGNGDTTLQPGSASKNPMRSL